MNFIEPYKNRTIDYNKPVLVYRNLNKKGVWYSIKQDDLVRAHSKFIQLLDCNFIVNENSRNKVRETGKKFPHAYIKGFVLTKQKYFTGHDRVKYNPKEDNYFTLMETKEYIHNSNLVTCTPFGVFALDYLITLEEMFRSMRK